MRNIQIYIFALVLATGFLGCTSRRPQDGYATTYPNAYDNYYPPIEKQKRDGIYHVVREGETLWRIAKTYNVDIEQLIKENNILDVKDVDKNSSIFIPGATASREIIHEEVGNKNEFVWPVQGKVIGKFRERQNGKINKGVDIQVKKGDVVRAARSGRVVFADYLSGYGKTIILDHQDGLLSVYSQNSDLLVGLSENVFKNTPIAHVGQNGNLAYLHFEIRKDAAETNPLYYLP